MDFGDDLVEDQTSREKPQHIRHGRQDGQRGTENHHRKGEIEKFLSRKKSILARLGGFACDNSPKGSVDELCLPLMNLLNSHEDYVTTSSCSGRIAIFHSSSSGSSAEVIDEVVRKKRGDALGWLFVSHSTLDQTTLDELVRSLRTEIATTGQGTTHPLLTAPLPHVGIVSLKCEPFVMHVQCRTMAAAKTLLTAALASGFRNSGVTPPGSNTIVAIRHAGLAIDAPLAIDGALAVSNEEFLRRLLLLCNEKLTENMSRIDLLTQRVADALSGSCVDSTAL